METQEREPSRLDLAREREELVRFRERGGVNAQEVALALELNPMKLLRLEKYQEFDRAFIERYRAEVRRITRERAEATGWTVS